MCNFKGFRFFAMRKYFFFRLDPDREDKVNAAMLAQTGADILTHAFSVFSAFQDKKPTFCAGLGKRLPYCAILNRDKMGFCMEILFEEEGK